MVDSIESKFNKKHRQFISDVDNLPTTDIHMINYSPSPHIQAHSHSVHNLTSTHSLTWAHLPPPLRASPGTPPTTTHSLTWAHLPPPLTASPGHTSHLHSEPHQAHLPPPLTASPGHTSHLHSQPHLGTPPITTHSLTWAHLPPPPTASPGTPPTTTYSLTGHTSHHHSQPHLGTPPKIRHTQMTKYFESYFLWQLNIKERNSVDVVLEKVGT